MKIYTNSLCTLLPSAVYVVTMDTVLEQQRRLHEERERVEDALMKEMILKKNTVRTSSASCPLGLSLLPLPFLSLTYFHSLSPSLPPSLPLSLSQVRDQINSEHRMKGLVDRSLDCAEKLVTLYEDRDG